jgi:DNA-binding transcriptional ArsR family regulator
MTGRLGSALASSPWASADAGTASRPKSAAANSSGYECKRVHMCYTALVVPHPAEHASASRPLGAAEADDIAETLKALASPSRLRMLAALLDGERTVEELAVAVELSPSATSHNLRILRSLRLVRARRAGRHTFYALHDHHMADLLAAVRHHHEHVHPPASIRIPDAEPRTPTEQPTP